MNFVMEGFIMRVYERKFQLYLPTKINSFQIAEMVVLYIVY